MSARSIAASAALLAVLALPLASQTAVPTTAAFLGFEPGADRKLADYDQVCAYFAKLAATTDRVRFSSIGKTTENHELMLAIISSPKNLASLEEIRKTNLALVDPRKLNPGEAAPLIARGKTIVCLNASIHSTEVGPTQATLPLAYFLATTQDPEWLRVLDDVVLLMLPCHNPDGYVKVVDWYRRWVGTPHEACPYPGLYHPYAGHDNNRDWFMFNLQETRLTVKEVYLKWAPQIVMDLHQMGDDGPRMFIPPYQDPIEPNVDPLLIQNLNDLGLSVQKELLAKGMKGIVNRTLFDGWSPSRAYMHYHGGVRFLCEVASCRIATPLEKKGLAHKAESRSSTNPEPWSGDRWSLADIVRYQDEAAMAVLEHASANRERWLTSFADVFRKACASSAQALVIDGFTRTPTLKAAKVLDILDLGGVEAYVDEDSFRTSGQSDLVIPQSQPFFSFAAALLRSVPYPEFRETATAPVRKPYDVTAHVLSLLLDFPEAELRNRPLGPGNRQVHAYAGFEAWQGGLATADALQVAIYSSSLPNVTDEGWARFVLEHEFGVSAKTAALRSVKDSDLVSLAESRPESAPATDRIRVLVLPSMTVDQILNGNQGEDFPPEFRGGIGDSGADAIERFVREGGTLIALKDASALAIQLFKLPVRNALVNLPVGRVNVPGAILRLDLDEKQPIARGMPRGVPVMFDGGKAFETDPAEDKDQTLRPVVIGRWAGLGAVRIAGYAEGVDLIAGRGALIQCNVGLGQVILFGFSPQFRGQSWATFPLLDNAIRTGLERD